MDQFQKEKLPDHACRAFPCDARREVINLQIDVDFNRESWPVLFVYSCVPTDEELEQLKAWLTSTHPPTSPTS
jgi:hypothetical protein